MTRRAGLLLASCIVCSLVLVGCPSGNGNGNPSASVAPTIATQPANQSVTATQTATFTVGATGTAPLSYQWQRNGAGIGGATSASYTTPATVSGDSGLTFRVMVTNSAGSATSNSATLTVTAAPVAPSITTQPANQTVAAGQTAIFTVVATGTAPLSYQWQKGTANITGATSASYTTPATIIADNGSTFRVTVSNGVNPPATSSSATLTVNPAPPPPPPSTVSVLTYHNDNSRAGLNANETILTKANVIPAKFGKIGTIPVDGLVDAQPLYVGGLNVGGTVRNVLFVATEHNSVYAFDADNFTQLWKRSVLGTNETTVPATDYTPCRLVDPELGITATPVIDPTPTPARPNGAIFVVAMSKSGSSYFQRLHALDLTTGDEIGTPTTIQATFQKPGQPQGQVVTFDPKQYLERTALLLLNGVIYTTWASHCDIGPYTGWIMGFNESNLQPASVLNITPNGSMGGIWMSGGGPAADASGNIYLLVGNGSFNPGTIGVNGFPADGDYGNAFLKLSTAGNSLSVADYFNMFNTVTESADDWDFGSGGAVVLVDMTDGTGTTRRLALGAGKDAKIYVVDRTNMGKFNASTNNIYQEIPAAFACPIPECVFSTPAFFNGTLYYGAVDDNLRAFPFTNAKLPASPMSQSSTIFGYPGTTPSISANGTSNGIVWAIQGCGASTSCTGTLHAIDAADLSKELFTSNHVQPSGGSNQFSTNAACKFVTPLIANGKVYVGTGTNTSGPSGAVIVFGLFP